MTLTYQTIRTMYAAAQKEMAEVWNAPHLYDLPLKFQSFEGTPQEGAIAFTAFDRWDERPLFVAYNTSVLPNMEEDEVRYGLFHELTHAILPHAVDHGPEFVDAVSYTTGVRAPWVNLRHDRADDKMTLDNPPTMADFAKQATASNPLERLIEQLSIDLGLDLDSIDLDGLYNDILGEEDES